MILLPRTIAAVVALSLPIVAYAATVTVPGQVQIQPLDIAIVTTGGTAVVALNAGHRIAGGWIFNPSGAAADLCINEQGTASGTTSAGSTVCIPAGGTLVLAPSSRPVSVVSSDSAHAFAGVGWTE